MSKKFFLAIAVGTVVIGAYEIGKRMHYKRQVKKFMQNLNKDLKEVFPDLKTDLEPS